MHVWFAVDNTVGFRLGSYRDGDLSVLQPTACVNITSSMKAIAKVCAVYKLIFAMCIIPHESKKTMTLLLLLSHPAIFVWSVWRDATHKSWMKSTPAHSSCHVCIRQTAVTSVQLTNLWGIIQQRVYQAKMQDVNDLRQNLIDVWAGMEQTVIDDDFAWAVAQTYPCLHSSQKMIFWILRVIEISR